MCLKSDYPIHFSSQCFKHKNVFFCFLLFFKKIYFPCYLLYLFIYFLFLFKDPSTNPAYSEERLAHEALQLEKRLSLLSHTSRQGSGGKKYL